MVRACDVTVGLVELLGARPRWGRALVHDDARRTDVHPVLIALSLAIERFGEPSHAIGQQLETTAQPLLVVGVMPGGFRYPSGTERIWRALDPRGPLAQGTAGISAIARLASGTDLKRIGAMIDRRSIEVGRAAGARADYSATATPLRSLDAPLDRRRMFLVLLGAALCLLLIACANVASLELANAVTRARTYAIHLAVGATRAALVRTALFEGIVLVGTAAVSAIVLARAGANIIAGYLPAALVGSSANPVDVDERALLCMTALAAIAWVASTFPVIMFAGHAQLLNLLKVEGASIATSRRSELFRRALTVAQVAFAVLLLVGTVLYVRSYLALLRLDKGFDSGGVVSISLTIPPQALATAAERQAKTETLLARIRARPGVLAAFIGEPPPATGDSPMSLKELEVDDQPPVQTELLFPKLYVDPDYFTALRIPLLRGRMFDAGEPPTSVLISQALAARLWPGQDAVGHRFRESPRRPWFEVIGVVGHVRLQQDGTTGPARYFQLYFSRQPPPPASAAAPRGRQFARPSFGFLTITARVDSRARTRDLLPDRPQCRPTQHSQARVRRRSVRGTVCRTAARCPSDRRVWWPGVPGRGGRYLRLDGLPRRVTHARDGDTAGAWRYRRRHPESGASFIAASCDRGRQHRHRVCDRTVSMGGVSALRHPTQRPGDSRRCGRGSHGGGTARHVAASTFSRPREPDDATEGLIAAGRSRATYSARSASTGSIRVTRRAGT